VLSAYDRAIASTPESTYPTSNGPKTEAALRQELAAAGYSGPWDVPSLLAAYGRATALASTPAASPERLTPFGSSVEEACKHWAEDAAANAEKIARGQSDLNWRPDGFFCPSSPSASPRGLEPVSVVAMGSLFEPARANLSRVSQDLYRDLITGTYVRTFGCPEPAIAEEAIVTSNEVIFFAFGRGTTCQLALR
jgi:hypothetical protein